MKQVAGASQRTAGAGRTQVPGRCAFVLCPLENAVPALKSWRAPHGCAADVGVLSRFKATFISRTCQFIDVSPDTSTVYSTSIYSVFVYSLQVVSTFLRVKCEPLTDSVVTSLYTLHTR